eukprot:6043684-Alexandrium_andersonii.AAC.1
MSASLVGSEMCIRDRPLRAAIRLTPQSAMRKTKHRLTRSNLEVRGPKNCLLYTSDAADDM